MINDKRQLKQLLQKFSSIVSWKPIPNWDYDLISL